MSSDAQALPLENARCTQPSEPLLWGLRLSVWLRMAVIAAAMAALFWPNLRRLWLKTNPFTGESNWLHSFFVPVIGVWYLYLNWDAILNPPPPGRSSPLAKALGIWLQIQIVIWGLTFFAVVFYEPLVQPGLLRTIAGGSLAAISVATLLLAFCAGRGIGPGGRRLQHWTLDAAPRSSGWFGMFTMLWGVAFYGWAIYPGQNDFLKDFGMVVTLFGVVLLLCGWQVMRTAWFPIAFLVCAIPWPGLVYSWVAMPLQQLAASVAVHALRMTGVDAMRIGTKLYIGGGRVLNVAEACAGLKSLMTFISVGAAVAFLSSRPLWQKIIISLSAIPIAIFCNVMRVAGQGLLDHYVSRKLSESFAHQFVGMFMLVPAFFLILLVGWIIDNLFIEETDRRQPAAQTTARDRVLVIEAGRQASAGGANVSEQLAAATLRLSGAGRASRSDKPESGEHK